MKFTTKILLFLLIISLGSCNLYRKLPKGKYLLKKNIVYVDSTKVKSDSVHSLIIQQPNSTIFAPAIYLLADQHPDITYYKWIHSHNNLYKILEKTISRKQIIQLQRYYKDVNKIIKDIGEPPVLIDTNKIGESAKRLKFYYVSHSFLDAQSGYTIDTINKYKAKVVYNVAKKDSYIIKEYEQDISSEYLQKVYKRVQDESFVKVNKPYRRDDFVKEKERLTDYFRNKGVYHFQPSYINFDLVYDTLQKSHNLSAYLNIPNRTVIKGDSVLTKPFLSYRIGQVNVYLSKNKNVDTKNVKDSIYFDKTYIYSVDGKIKYRPKLLTGSIFLKQGKLYSDVARQRTHRLLMSLQNFKQAYIQFKENEKDSTLTTNIYLIPEKRFSWEGSFDVTHSNIHDLGIKGGLNFNAKNLFKGAEILSTSAYLMLASSKTLNTNELIFDVREIGTDITLKFPRLLLPFGLSNYIPKYMLPKTYITFQSNVQENIALDRSKYVGIFGFEWRPIKERKYKIDLLNYEFITNKNGDNYYNIYTLAYEKVKEIAEQDLGVSNPPAPDATSVFISSYTENDTWCNQHPDVCKKLKIIKERENRITQNIFILSNKFDFKYDSRKNIFQRDFYIFHSNFELAGTILSPFAKILNFPYDQKLEQYTINSVPYAEYFRADLSLIKHWQLRKKHVLASRLFAGYAIPYGNSKSIPFVSSYFAGGSNDNRAWRAYTLGPGTSGGPNEFNEANFKLSANLEYRFPIAGYFNGALFSDAGNIWNINNNETDERSSFKGLASLQDVALGTGFGLRMDFTYFIIRVDLAYKTYDPSKPAGERWIDLKHTKLGDAVLNLGISYPF